jgi:hypothetical protein
MVAAFPRCEIDGLLGCGDIAVEGLQEFLGLGDLSAGRLRRSRAVPLRRKSAGELRRGVGGGSLWRPGWACARRTRMS